MGTVTASIALELEHLRKELDSATGPKRKEQRERIRKAIVAARLAQTKLQQIGTDLGNIFNALSYLPLPTVGNYQLMPDTETYYGPERIDNDPALDTIVSYLASILRYLERIQPQGSQWSHSEPPTGDAHEVIFHYLRHIRVIEFWVKYNKTPNYQPKQVASDRDHLIFQYEVDLIYQQFNLILKPNNLIVSPSGAPDDDSLMEAYTAGILGFFP